MTIDEMKNKISMELKSPVTQQGFEVICKTLVELEKENEELKKGLGCETCQIHLEYMSLNNKIADLERENAELKEDKDAKLERAREIIKNLLPMASKFVFGTLPKLDEEVRLYRQAEQFIAGDL